MTKISNPRRVRSEDFPKDSTSIVEPLGAILNPFMDEVVDIINGRVDFDNLKMELVQYETSVDSDGVPINTDKLRLSYTSIWGLIVINSENKTNIGTYPTSTPSLNYSLDGTNVITIKKINGLQADNKYLLTIIVIAK
jgi:hypothetical protein